MPPLDPPCYIKSTHYAAKQFQRPPLNRSDISQCPFQQFTTWFDQANHATEDQCEATTFSTVQLPQGRVSSRTVYLKEIDTRGFVFFTNFGTTSRKACDLRTNGWASMNFWWRCFDRQVRIEGVCEKIPYQRSQAYFSQRPRQSQIGAWASHQSSVTSPDQLTQNLRAQEARFHSSEPIPCPSFWGGIRIVPSSIEFWQGRDNRLHDRFRYSRSLPASLIEQASRGVNFGPVDTDVTTMTTESAARVLDVPVIPLPNDLPWTIERLSP